MRTRSERGGGARERPAGNLQAWAREVRYGEAERAGRRARRADRHRPHRERPGRDDPLPAGRLAGPARAARDGRRARDGSIRPLLGRHARADGRLLRARGLRWREDESNEDRALRAHARAPRAAAGAARRAPGRARRTCCGTAALLREETELLEGLVDRGARAGRGDAIADRAPARAARGARAAGGRAPGRGAAAGELRAAGGRARGGDPRARPPRRGGRAARRRRARRGDRGRRAADGQAPARATTTATGGDRRPRTRLRGGAHARTRSGRAGSGEVLVTAEDLQRRVARAGASRSRATTPAGRCCWSGVLKGAVFFLSDLMRFIEIPVEVDFMAVASYGSATDSSGVVRILKDLDAAIEGRDVLIVEDIVDSGPDAAVPAAQPRLAQPAHARGLRAADQARAAQGAICRPATSASRSPTGSSSATAWTTPSATATCRSWPCWRAEASAAAREAPRRPGRNGRKMRRLAWYARGLRGHDFRRCQETEDLAMSRSFKSAAFPILIVVVLAFLAVKLVNPSLEPARARTATRRSSAPKNCRRAKSSRSSSRTRARRSTSS